MSNPYLAPTGPSPREQPTSHGPEPTPTGENAPPPAGSPYVGYTPPPAQSPYGENAPPPAGSPYAGYASHYPAYTGYGPPDHPYGGYSPYSPQPPRRMARWAVASISAAIAGVLGGLLGYGIGSVNEQGDNSAVPNVTMAPDDPDDGGAWGPDDKGSPRNPYPFDTVPFAGNDWTVTLSQAPYNATDQIMTAQEGHAAPGEGLEYWIVPVKAQYIGTGTSKATAAQQIMVFFLDTDGRRYMDSCGKIPNDLAATGNPARGGTVTGNLCVQVPEGAGGVWGLFQEDGWLAYLAEDGVADGTEA